MKCEICHKGLDDGIALFRHNTIGFVPAIWRCREHLEKTIDSEVNNITKIIEEYNENNGGSK